jgi:lipase maturation factor 1
VSGRQIPWAWRPKLALDGQEVPLFVMVKTFLAFVGLVYFIAFTSFGIQAQGLVGSHGILPFEDFFAAVRASLGKAGYWEEPTLLWLSWTDNALRVAWIGGALAALAAIFSKWQRTALAVCLVLWVSVCTAGQDFLSFQWDILLSEIGFVAIFAGTSRVSVWLFRWLAFRLMFFSGVVKLMSGDPTWRDLTALRYHYETQPLPTPLAWYFHQLPLSFQKASTVFTFVTELIVPFLFFAPRKWRYVGAAVTALLQLLIIATGNYTFFNLLALGLLVWLFIEPDGSKAGPLLIAAAVFVGVVSVVMSLGVFGIAVPGGGVILRFTSPLRIVNSYGLFAVMTTERQEISVEGSDDGLNWKVYEFLYKPGDLRRAPPWVEPHQPRLDWQMWFAALGTYQQNRWFVNFMIRLLQGEKSVLKLIEYNPFPQAPPKYVRARLYLYHFTKWGQPGWWTREDRGLYFPVASLK